MKRQDELNEVWCKYRGKCSTEIIQALAFALRWCDAHPNWISVEDELPPKESEYDDLSNNVLATDGKEIYESVYNHDFEEWFTHDLWAINNITHWMPMPAPPHHFPDVNKMVSGSSEFPNNCQSVTPRNQSKGGEK